VDFEVVPGVSSFAAAPAAAGIPVTHRGISAQVTIVSGHSCDGEELDYEALARTPGTLVVFMGLRRLAAIARGLVEHGRDPETPAAVVSAGTTPGQESVTGTLATIADDAAGLASPGLIVVGDVVGLADELVPTLASLEA
jgi:siroheme synthase